MSFRPIMPVSLVACLGQASRQASSWRRSRPIMGSETANLSSECVTSTMTPGQAIIPVGYLVAKVHSNDRTRCCWLPAVRQRSGARLSAEGPD